MNCELPKYQKGGIIISERPKFSFSIQIIHRIKGVLKSWNRNNNASLDRSSEPHLRDKLCKLAGALPEDEMKLLQNDNNLRVLVAKTPMKILITLLSVNTSPQNKSGLIKSIIEILNPGYCNFWKKENNISPYERGEINRVFKQISSPENDKIKECLFNQLEGVD
ncbi:hypothetical protein HON22_02970 [Candidatus Peregrinibacteria bacterium]|jgi:hypothetical protein|nr:hypothetical protein [Candidatus Peregrinibacteria bacterium]